MISRCRLDKDGSVFTLGGSFTGGIGDKYGEIWNPDNRDWTLLPDVEADGSVVTDDALGLQTGEYVYFVSTVVTHFISVATTCGSSLHPILIGSSTLVLQQGPIGSM